MEHRVLWFMVFYDGLRQGAFLAVLENDRSLPLSKNGTHAFWARLLERGIKKAWQTRLCWTMQKETQSDWSSSWWFAKKPSR